MGKRHRQETVLDYLDRNATLHPDTVAVVEGETELTWSRYRERVRATALALLELGVEQDQVVGLHMVNRIEHAQSDLAALMLGAVPTSYYNTLAEEQLAFVAADSAATVAIVDAEQLPKWLVIWPQLPDLRYVLVLDADPDQPLPRGVLRFESCVDSAETRLADYGGEVDAARSAVHPDDPLTIVYTSGTTGPPKGTLITHSGAVWTTDEVKDLMEDYLGGPVPAGWNVVSYLPLAHIAERTFSHYCALSYCYTVRYVRDIADLPHALTEARPRVFLGVPRVWERMYGAIRERAVSATGARRWLGGKAISVARKVGAHRLGGGTRRGMARARMWHPFLELVVYRRIRARLGLDQVVFPASGAAQLPPDVAAFFAGIGIPIIEIYGMTESCAILTVSPPGAPRMGSVGKPLPNLQLKIASDGEILVQGPNITSGYLHRPDATAESLDAAGWWHTGDLGTLDDDGYLRIIGRKKDLINTASGKTISPANVELALGEGSDLIGSVYVHGDDKPCLVALVTLDPASWREWCQARQIHVETLSEAVNNGRVRLEVARSIGAGNARLSRVEQVKNWALLAEPWTVQTGELTPTMKIKRPVIAERYRDDIEALYDPITADAWVED